MSELIYKSAKVAKVHDDNGDRTLSGIITRETVDEEGEVIVAKGLDLSYNEKVGGVSVLWNHDYDKPIGKVRRVVPTDDGWKASIYISKTDRGDEALTLARDGILHFSIGFMRIDHGRPTEDEKARYPGAEYITRESRIHELTLTPVPAHGDANLAQKALKRLRDEGKIRNSTYIEFAPEPTRLAFPVDSGKKLDFPHDVGVTLRF